MLLTYNCILLKMSTWYSKHVEENIRRINNIKCITLVFLVWSIHDVTVRKTLSIFGGIYRRFRLFFPVSIYYLWPFEMCQSAPLRATLYFRYGVEIIFPQSLHYQHTFFTTVVWDAGCRSRKTLCWSVGTLHACCVSARHPLQNGVVGVHPSAGKRMEEGGCWIGTVGSMRRNILRAKLWLASCGRLEGSC